MNRLILLMASAFMVLAASAADTTRRQLTATDGRRIVPIIQDSVVVAEVDSIAHFDAQAITLSGFKKRASDTQESFFVTNNSRFHITQIKILLRYFDIDGRIITERTATIPCDAMPGATVEVRTRSFDHDRAYHYRFGSRPRKQSTAFDVAFRLIRYDIAVTR